MKKTILLTLTFFCISNLNYAQLGSKPDSSVIVAMEKLSWLEGGWTGGGWVDTRDSRHLFDQSETITTKVKGTVMLIEGLGQNKHDKSIVHEAFAVLSYDQYALKYLMRTFKSDGKYVDAKARVENDGTLIWGFKNDDMPEVRYTIKLVEGKWFEIGEFSLSGEKWTKFYEMTLTKK